MKTIKELEAEHKEQYQRCVDETKVEGKATYLSHGVRCETLGQIMALKDVLELIDEKVKTLRMDIQNAYECDYVNYQVIEEICLGKIKELEELKKRING